MIAWIVPLAVIHTVMAQANYQSPTKVSELQIGRWDAQKRGGVIQQSADPNRGRGVELFFILDTATGGMKICQQLPPANPHAFCITQPAIDVAGVIPGRFKFIERNVGDEMNPGNRGGVNTDFMDSATGTLYFCNVGRERQANCRKWDI